jgi:hypothetical protein
MPEFTTAGLETLTAKAGMVFPPQVVAQLVAALDSGTPVVLTGAPGTGKTTLAYLAADLGQLTMRCTGYLAVTATSEWDTSHTIGSYLHTPSGPVFQPGVFLEAIESGQWLVIDELNRSNFDGAFGPLLTVLAGQAVTLPYKRAGSHQSISIVPYGVPVPTDTDAIRVSEPWRMIATMNVFDRDLLFQLSYALMRRFAFIEVESPSDDVIHRLLTGPGELVARLLPMRSLIDLGPALFLDSAKYAVRRLEDPDVTPSRVLYELFHAYFLPQLDRLDDAGARELYGLIAEAFDNAEQISLRRVIRNTLGSKALPPSETAGQLPVTGTPLPRLRAS